VRNAWQAPSDATLEDLFERTRNDLRSQRFQQQPSMTGTSGIRTRSLSTIASGAPADEHARSQAGGVRVISVDGEAVALAGGTSTGVTAGSIFAVGSTLLRVVHVAEDEIHATRASTDLRGISAASERVIWASGSGGTILRTGDGGRSWQRVSPPDTSGLDFRDVDAIDERTAYALSIGPGDASRIYKTADAGATWTLQFRNTDQQAFYDAMAFSSASSGYAVSDSVDGRLVRTSGSARARVRSAWESCVTSSAGGMVVPDGARGATRCS
jgi:hypothetical protein